MSFFNELKRRNVFRVGAAYVVISWLALQVSDVLVEALELPLVWSKALIALLIIGFIPTLAFSWVYEMTPKGLMKESETRNDDSITHQTARKLDVVVILLLMAAIALFVLDRYTGPVNEARTAALASSAQPTQTIEDSENGVPVVAVLPFKAMSSSEEGTFLASGLHDDLLTKLAKLKAFKVISRTSVMEYANTAMNMREIGEELGAGYILEGGLQAIGGRVSISAQLINAPSDEHLWAETFNRPLTTTNLFEVQGEIATAISVALHATLSPGEIQLLAQVPTENMDAYRAYLRGLEHAENLDSPSMMASIDAFSEAVVLDPDFADAWARLSRALMRQYWEQGGEQDAAPDESLVTSARQALDRAQVLAPDNVDVLLSEAYFYYYAYRDYSAALIELEKAEAIAPYNHYVIASRGFLLRRIGRLNEAADYLVRSREYGPGHIGHLRESTITLMDAGRCEEAMKLVPEGLARFPEDNGILMGAGGATLVCEGDAETAHRIIEQVEVTTPSEFFVKLDILLHTGDVDGAIELALSGQIQFMDNPVLQLSIANRLSRLYGLTNAGELAGASMRRAGVLAAEIDEVGAFALQELAMEAALRGDTERAVQLGRRGLEAFPRDAYIKPEYQYRMLSVFVLAGAGEVAWRMFQKWLPVAHYTELQVIQLNPFLEPLRANPGFEAARAQALQQFQ